MYFIIIKEIFFSSYPDNPFISFSTPKNMAWWWTLRWLMRFDVLFWAINRLLHCRQLETPFSIWSNCLQIALLWRGMMRMIFKFRRQIGCRTDSEGAKFDKAKARCDMIKLQRRNGTIPKHEFWICTARGLTHTHNLNFHKLSNDNVLVLY